MDWRFPGWARYWVRPRLDRGYTAHAIPAYAGVAAGFPFATLRHSVHKFRNMSLSSTTPDFLLTSVLVPVILLTLRALLGREIEYWIAYIHCYFHRPYDVDNDPNTHDWAMIFNSASGSWECCSLTFHFGLRKGGNGVFVHHYDDSWNLLFTQRLPFGQWRRTGKARLNEKNLPEGLRRKIYNLRYT